MDRFLEKIVPFWVPHDGQRLFLEDKSKIRVLACGRRWGKTDACAISLLGVMANMDRSRQVIIAPTQAQASMLFDRCIELAADIFEGETLKIKRTPFPTLKMGDHKIVARSAFRSMSLRGMEATHVIIDEAAFVAEEVIYEAVMPMLASSSGEMILISTPRGKNHFWRFFSDGQAGRENVWSYKAPTHESPRISSEFLAWQRELISERAYQVEYEAEFVDPVGQIFATEDIEKCITDSNLVKTLPVFIGVDWARYGDRTAVVVMSGVRSDARVLEMTLIQGTAWNIQVEKVVEIIKKWQPERVVCDSTGVGDAVTENLRMACPTVFIEPCVFTAPFKRGIIDNLAWMFQRQAISMPRHVELLRELNHFMATTNSRGRSILSAQSGYHDDLICAMALAANRLARNETSLIHIGGTRQFSNGAKNLQ